MRSYGVTLRGLVPPDLARKVSQAHADALKYAQVRVAKSAADGKPSEGEPPRGQCFRQAQEAATEEG